MSYESVSE